MITAYYQLTPGVPFLTNGRVDFDEPQAGGPTGGECGSDPTVPALRIGVRLQVRKPGDAASRKILEMGTCWPGTSCWFTYATILDVASSAKSVVFAEPGRSTRKAGVAYAVRRVSDVVGWTFRENGDLRGVEQLTSEWSEVEWVRGFAESDAANDGSSVAEVIVKLRRAEDFGNVSAWPPGWPATLVAASDAACGSVEDEATAKAIFDVNSGTCVDTADPGWEDPGFFEMDPVDIGPPGDPPTPYEARFIFEEDDLDAAIGLSIPEG